jgi:hypothetical protein
MKKDTLLEGYEAMLRYYAGKSICMRQDVMRPFTRAATAFHLAEASFMRGKCRQVDLIRLPPIFLHDDPTGTMTAEIGIVVARATGLPLLWIVRPTGSDIMADMEAAAVPFLAKGGLSRIGSTNDVRWAMDAVAGMMPTRRPVVAPRTLAEIEAAIVGAAIIWSWTAGSHARGRTPAMRAGIVSVSWDEAMIAEALPEHAPRSAPRPTPVPTMAPPSPIDPPEQASPWIVDWTQVHPMLSQQHADVVAAES